MLLLSSNFLLWFLLLGAPLFGAAWTIVQRSRNRLQQRQRDSLARIIRLKDLLLILQRHRGISYGALRGDLGLRTDLASLESGIAEHINALQELSDQAELRDHWQAFVDHWQRLRHNNLSLEAENNLEQHSRLIGVLFHLLEDIAETGRLFELEGDELGQWRQSLRTAEWIGQARALGLGMLATGHSDSVDRIRMRFLQSKLEACARNEPNDLTQAAPLRKLVDVIERELLSALQPTLAAKDYFELATQSMQPLTRNVEAGMRGLAATMATHRS